MGWLKRLFGLGGTDAPAIQWRQDSFPTEVVGESHYQDALIAICGAYSRQGYEIETHAEIRLDPRNPYDTNAVAVFISNRKVGHLNRDQAVRVGGALRELGLSRARCQAKIAGGWRTNQYDEGQFGVRLAIPGYGKIDFGSAGISLAGSAETAMATRKSVEVAKGSGVGPLAKQRIAIIGAPSDCEIAKLLANAGATIVSGVGKTTSMLVVVGQSKPFDPGTIGSSNYVKAEELIAAGRQIRILDEGEARQLLA